MLRLMLGGSGSNKFWLTCVVLSVLCTIGFGSFSSKKMIGLQASSTKVFLMGGKLLLLLSELLELKLRSSANVLAFGGDQVMLILGFLSGNGIFRVSFFFRVNGLASSSTVSFILVGVLDLVWF